MGKVACGEAAAAAVLATSAAPDGCGQPADPRHGKRGTGPACGQLGPAGRRHRRPVLTSSVCRGVIGVTRLGGDVHIRRRERDDSVYDYDLLVIGSGPGGQKAAIAAAKLGKRAAVVERRAHGGRGLHQHRHDPVEDPARGRPLPHRLRQRDLYGASYRVKEDITIGDLLARTQHVDRPRDGGHPQPAAAATTSTSSAAPPSSSIRTPSACTAPSAATTTPSPPTRSSSRRAPGRPARRTSSSTSERVLDSDGVLQHRAGARLDGRGRRRRDRHRVRLDVRRARHPGDRRREAPGDARLLRPRGRRGAEVPPARPGGDLPLRRGGREGRGHPARHGHQPGQRQAHRRGHGHVLRGPAGRHRRARPRGGGAGGRQPRPDQGRRALPHRGRAHLRRRRRDRLPGARRDARWSRAGWRPTTRSANRRASCRACSRSASTPIPEISYCGQTEDGADQGRRAVRGRACRATASWRAAQIVGDSYGMLKLLVSTEDRDAAGRARLRHRAPPSSCTSARR